MSATRPRFARTANVVTVAVIALLMFDAVTHLVNPPFVRTSMRALGFSESSAPMIGIIELVCVALYAVRRTAPLGAVLLTGHLGGAMAINMRADKPVLSTVMFPLYVGVVVWAPLVIRRSDIRALVTSVFGNSRRIPVATKLGGTRASVEAAGTHR